MLATSLSRCLSRFNQQLRFKMLPHGSCILMKGCLGIQLCSYKSIQDTLSSLLDRHQASLRIKISSYFRLFSRSWPIIYHLECLHCAIRIICISINPQLLDHLPFRSIRFDQAGIIVVHRRSKRRQGSRFTPFCTLMISGRPQFLDHLRLRQDQIPSSRFRSWFITGKCFCVSWMFMH